MSAALTGFYDVNSPVHAERDPLPSPPLLTAWCGRTAQSYFAVRVSTFSAIGRRPICRACVQAVEAEHRRKNGTTA